MHIFLPQWIKKPLKLSYNLEENRKAKANLIPVNRKCALKIQFWEHKYLITLSMS